MNGMMELCRPGGEGRGRSLDSCGWCGRDDALSGVLVVLAAHNALGDPRAVGARNQGCNEQKHSHNLSMASWGLPGAWGQAEQVVGRTGGPFDPGVC